MNKPSIVFFALIITIFLESTSSGENKTCDLTKLPIERESSCEQYIQLDKRLNTAYKKLIALLDKNSADQLRKTQREWISFRDEKCEKEQEISGCNNGLCQGVAHDDCVLALTGNRTSELKNFTSNIDAAKSVKFYFSKKDEFDAQK